MTLPASLLHDGETQTVSVESRVEHVCELAKQRENKGLYEEARQALSAYWPHPGERPLVKDLLPGAVAELLLRAGVITGALGGKTQLTGAQEAAKNLISESLSIFQSLNYQQKIDEAQVELALCYWRTGEVNEARDLLEETLSRLKGDSDVRCRAIVRLAIVEYEESRLNEALGLLTTN